jgi:2-octaprenylphenol hydroxylase
LSETEHHFDTLIVGGGMVGNALACALGQQEFRVAVIELREPAREWPADEIDLRVSALTRASQNILQNLGAWERMAQLRVSPYQEMQVWDAEGSGSIHFGCSEIWESDLGHIVENRVTQLALWEQLEKLPNVHRFCPATIEKVELDGPRPLIQLEDGSRLSTELLVGADGRDSRIRQAAGIKTRGWDYDQHGLVSTVKTEKPHRETAWQRFMPTGPLAFLPLNDGRCSIVWSTSPERASELLELKDTAFCDALSEASGFVLGRIQKCGPRAAFPLRLQHANNYVQPGLALVGDAAHAVHPLAGQGVNLGFLDAATLAEVLVDARRKGRKLGALSTLRRYERARKGANMGMLAAMDGFKRLFSNKDISLSLLRNLGLNLTDAAWPVKHLIMRRALGQFGELPRLAKPGASL